LRQPNLQAAPRVFVPTRPTMLGKGERVRIFAVVPGPAQVVSATLFTRSKSADAWSALPMTLEQRRTYTGEIQWREEPGPLMDYYVEVRVQAPGAKKILTSPPEAPDRYHTVTLL
jgi:hypothetical protein